MKITMKMLSQYEKPCEYGIAWFEKQESHELTALVKNAIKSGLVEMQYCNWGLTHCMTKVQMVRYSCYAARQVLKNYNDKYPNDDRVIGAIKAAEAWANNPCEETARAAYSAARAAYSAAASADSAAYSADSAAYSANSAARAARIRMMAKILRYGVKILMEGK